jgi:hypothetical protein
MVAAGRGVMKTPVALLLSPGTSAHSLNDLFVTDRSSLWMGPVPIELRREHKGRKSRR